VNVAIVGCGLIGRKRAAVLARHGDALVVAADVAADRAQALAVEHGCGWTASWQDAVSDPRVEIVIASTTNEHLRAVSVAALRGGKHVLCEKPLGRSAAEAQDMVDASAAAARTLKTGFNHRHHPGIRQAHDVAASGRLGELMFVRAVYGHGGRAGYEKEWRGNKQQSGGGELLDQGVHVIDLCRWFLGDIAQASGVTCRYVWDIAPLEDNAFALLHTAKGRVASFHTSWTQWKNRFSFEVFGSLGYASVEGLGGSYGSETLVVGIRRAQGGAPAQERFVYPERDDSWDDEWVEFRRAIDDGREPLGSGADGLAAALVIDALYSSSTAAGTPVLVSTRAGIPARPHQR
jgi:predicted dehydrogenase